MRISDWSSDVCSSDLLVFPLGTEGLMLAFVAMAVAAAIILFWPSAPDPTPETLMKTDLAELPLRIEEWLERQRAALPAPAARLVDGIALTLAELTPQPPTLDHRHRTRVLYGKSVAVRVVLGGGRILKKKQNKKN